MKARKSILANKFYPGSKKKLNIMIQEFMQNVEVDFDLDSIKAIVSPHAGYVYSGGIASYSYKLLKQNWNSIGHKFVILAPGHRYANSKISIGNYDYYETPYGRVNVDNNIANNIMKNNPELFEFEPSVHSQEHSIEVQLPFLQYIAGDDSFDIVPMVFGKINQSKISDILEKLMSKYNITFIVSTDLSHYNPYSKAQKLDKKTIGYILEKDIQNLHSEAKACGLYPLLTLTQIAKNKNWNTKLLKYGNSGDTSNRKDQVVGYAGIVYFS